MKKFIFVLFLGAFCFSTLAKTILFGTEATYAPFEYYNEQNQLTGFDIEIAKLVCEVSQLNCEFKNQSFDSLIPSLKTRRIDAAIAAIDITDARREQVLFTHAYYNNTAVFLAQKGAFTALDSLKSKRIGVQNGTTHQKYLMRNYPFMQLVPYDSYQYAILDLKSGRIDAIFSDAAVGSHWVTVEKNLAIVGKRITDPDYFGAGFAIAVRQGNGRLVGKFNEALTKIHADGRYKKIHDRWFK